MIDRDEIEKALQTNEYDKAKLIIELLLDIRELLMDAKRDRYWKNEKV